MTSACYDNMMVYMGQALIPWATGNTTLWTMLTDSTAPTKATHSTYNDVKAQPSPQLATAGTYVAGGIQLAPTTPTMTATVTKFPAAAASIWSGATFSTYFAILHQGATLTTTTGPLISYHDLGGVQTVSNGTLTLTWSASGIFTMTCSAAA